MLFLHFILAYFLKVNKTNYKTIIEQSYKIPAFMLIFSPHCPHCTAVHPSWEELMKKYETDTKVIVGECNAIENRQECKSLFQYTGYPTFVLISRGRSKEISPKRTIESFINETEKLKMIDFSIPCSTFQSEFDNNYPAFILTSNKPVLEKCNMLQKIEKFYPQVKTHLYLNATSSEIESLVALTSSNNYIKYEGNSDIESLTNFLQELMMVPFGDWNYSDASLFNKRIGLLIYSSHNEYLSFSRIITPYSSKFSLCKIDIAQFSKIFPKIKLTSDILPAFAISNKEKTKFFILKYVLRDKKFQAYLKESVEGQLDKTAEYDLSALFPNQKKKKLLLRSKITNILADKNKIGENKIKNTKENRIKHIKEYKINQEKKNKIQNIIHQKISENHEKYLKKIKKDEYNESKKQEIKIKQSKNKEVINDESRENKRKENRENKAEENRENKIEENKLEENHQKNENQIIENGKKKMKKPISKLATKNFKVFISITVFLSFLAVFGIMYFLKKADDKIE